MNAQPKQKLYKTAFSPMYGVFVSIDHAHQDDRGEWIFTCSSHYSDNTDCQFSGHLFRTNELERFTL